jgi:mono/diheme cytochrome c family protein
MRIVRLALPLALLLLAGPALAQESTLTAGKRLSEINCTRCHNIEAAGESPLTDAPPFRELAKNYDPEELVDGFMEGLAVRHPLMPDWDMTEEQAQALTSYIMSLKGDMAKSVDSPIILGHELLRENCARCHAIDATSASSLGKAPPFRDVVKKYDPSTLEEALAEGIVTGHNDMPEFTFEPDQITAITAYLETLKMP